MNVTSAFNRGCGGSLSSEAAQVYDSFMGNMLQKYENLSGWLSETVDSVKKAHNNFMSSKMWEFSNRIGRQGHYVGRFEIGYLSEVQFQQQATGFMRNYILANPTMMALYETEQISGYDGDFSDMCSGVSHGNYYYDKAMDGIVTQNENDEYFYRTYHTSLDEGTHLSPRERFDIQRTWRASDIHIKNLFDPSNIVGGNVLSLEEVEERRKEQEAESN